LETEPEIDSVLFHTPYSQSNLLTNRRGFTRTERFWHRRSHSPHPVLKPKRNDYTDIGHFAVVQLRNGAYASVWISYAHEIDSRRFLFSLPCEFRRGLVHNDLSTVLRFGLNEYQRLLLKVLPVHRESISHILKNDLSMPTVLTQIMMDYLGVYHEFQERRHHPSYSKFPFVDSLESESRSATSPSDYFASEYFFSSAAYLEGSLMGFPALKTSPTKISKKSKSPQFEKISSSVQRQRHVSTKHQQNFQSKKFNLRIQQPRGRKK